MFRVKSVVVLCMLFACAWGKMDVGVVEPKVAVSKLGSVVPSPQSVPSSGGLPSKLSLDEDHKLSFTTFLEDRTAKAKVTPHQVFLRFRNEKSGREVQFAAVPEADKMYRFVVKVKAHKSSFGLESGDYTIDLIVGDVNIQTPFEFLIGKSSVTFNEKPAESVVGIHPEIHHQFREPEKRTPTFVSLVFCGLVLSPWLILFALWGKIGISVSIAGPSVLAFHGLLVAICGLLVKYFINMTMFETLSYLIPLSAATFLVGNSALRAAAAEIDLEYLVTLSASSQSLAMSTSSVKESMGFYCFAALESSLTGCELGTPTSFGNEKYPLFVSWHKTATPGKRRLRGCIGCFSPLPLHSGLADYAITSSMKDSRFAPVSLKELPKLDCAVSLLTHFEERMDYLDWEVGRHGIWVEFTDRSGRKRTATYLPEVAEEQGWGQMETVVSCICKGLGKEQNVDDILPSAVVTRYQSEKVLVTYEQYSQAKQSASVFY
eukprot:Nk52_evm60s207 gene=Nk52_evmTU60s207